MLNTLRDPQVWRDLAWLITHSVLGFAFGVAALVAGRRASSGSATLPLWYWSIPDGVDFGLWNVALAAGRPRDRAAGHPAGVRDRVGHARDGQVARVAGRRAAGPVLRRSPIFGDVREPQVRVDLARLRPLEQLAGVGREDHAHGRCGRSGCRRRGPRGRGDP